MFREEGVDIVTVVEVQMIINMPDDSPPQEVTTKLLPVLSGEHQTSLQEPGHQLGPSEDPAVEPHVVTEVVEHLVHAGRQVVLDEHRGHGPGGLVQVLPGGQHDLRRRNCKYHREVLTFIFTCGRP